ncbi:MAG: YjfB family protein [Lachnospiraceae bacterium]|nr:YjfB family protein [Lachnospiraceae bacterium]
MEIDALTSTALSALNASSIGSDIGVAILAKQLDVSENMGDNFVRAMELSVNPYVGSNFDAFV